MSKDLKQKAATGMVWTSIERFSSMIIQFISGIVLARLLTPYDYGCIGMLAIFMSLAQSFIDGGFGSALIQKKKPTQEDYSTIFFWSLAMAVIMYALLYFTAPAISRFYNIPLLCRVLRVQALVLLIYAFNIIQRNRIRKKLNFKLLAIITIITSLIALMVTIFMAYHGFGVWALVAQNLITAAIPAVVFWFYVRWRPTWVFSKQSFRELFGFGSFLFLTNMINVAFSQIRGLLIGRIYSANDLGYFSKARSTEAVASQSLTHVMTQVTYPLYSESQDDKIVLGNMIKRLTGTVAYMTFPILFIMILIAKPLFLVLYTDKWLAGVPYFQILCIAGLADSLQSVNLQSISAIGKSKTNCFWTIIKRFIGLIFIIVGLILGDMRGLLWGSVVGAWFSYMVNIQLVSKYIGYKWQEQLLDLCPIVVVSLLSAFTSLGFSAMFHLNCYWDGALRIIIFAFVYFGWSVIFKPEPYRYSISIIKMLIKK